MTKCRLPSGLQCWSWPRLPSKLPPKLCLPLHIVNSSHTQHSHSQHTTGESCPMVMVMLKLKLLRVMFNWKVGTLQRKQSCQVNNWLLFFPNQLLRPLLLLLPLFLLLSLPPSPPPTPPSPLSPPSPSPPPSSPYPPSPSFPPTPPSPPSHGCTCPRADGGAGPSRRRETGGGGRGGDAGRSNVLHLKSAREAAGWCNKQRGFLWRETNWASWYEDARRCYC